MKRPVYNTLAERDVIEGMACAMWIDYAAGGGTRATEKHWLEVYNEPNEKSKDGFRFSARAALKALQKMDRRVVEKALK